MGWPGGGRTGRRFSSRTRCVLAGELRSGGGGANPVCVPDVVTERPDGRVPQDEVGVGHVRVANEDFAAPGEAQVTDQVPARAVRGDVSLRGPRDVTS